MIANARAYAAQTVAIVLAGFFLGLLLAALALPVAARAQSGIPTPAPGKTVSIIVYGDDPCPKGEGDEIVVCSRQPESERYRIPKRFRGSKKSSPAGVAWGSKVRATEDASRMAAGLPNTCSAVGTGGQTGCWQQFQQQAAAARQQPGDHDIPDPR